VIALEIAFAGLGLGTAPLGNLYAALSDEVADATLDAAWQSGIRFFDTAPHYGLGLAERRLGRFLESQPRDEFVVSTKVGRLLRPRTPPADRDDDIFEVPGDLTRVRDDTAEGVRTSLRDSLERMGLDRIDIAWLHDPDDTMDDALATAAPALQALKDEGVIRAWGVGMNDASALHRFVLESTPDLIMLAGRHTLLEPTQSLPLLDDCLARGVGVVAVGVFNSGLLASDEIRDDATWNYLPAPPEQLARARALADLCHRHDVSLPQAALAFPRRHPAVVNVTMGAATPEQVRQNVALASRPVPETLYRELQTAP